MKSKKTKNKLIRKIYIFFSGLGFVTFVMKIHENMALRNKWKIVVFIILGLKSVTFCASNFTFSSSLLGIIFIGGFKREIRISHG